MWSQLIFLTIFLTILLWIYLKQKLRFWESRGVPCLPASLPFGHIGNPRTRKNPIYMTLFEHYRHFKNLNCKYAGIYLSIKPELIPIDISLIRRILAVDFAQFNDRGLTFNDKQDPLSSHLLFLSGDRWRSLRQKLTPTFSSGKMKMMFPIVSECAQMLSDSLSKHEGAICEDIREVFACYSTDVIGSCAFGLNCGSFDDPDAEFRKYTKKIFEYDLGKTLKRLFGLLFPNLSKYFDVSFAPPDVREFFLRAVNETVKMRRELGVKRNDFLQLLMDLEDQGQLEQRMFAAQCFIFFVAGFETSSTALTYLFYEMAMNPDVQEKVRREIFETFADNAPLTYDDVKGLKYASQVIEETLRKYPTIPFLNRQAQTDYKIDDSLTLPKNCSVLISVMGLHHDPDYFPDPERFDPDRFSDERRKNIVPFSYLPFGEGPKNCIGLRFGQMQVKVALVEVLRKFYVKPNENTPEHLKFDVHSFTLKTQHEISLDFVPLKH